jgi:Zn-dependent protease with chaperone function
MLDNTSSSLGGKASAELEAVFAHEFSHLKDGWIKAFSGRAAVVGVPVIGIAAFYLLKRAYEKHDPKHKQSEKELAQALKEKVEHIAAGEIQQAEQVDHRIDEMQLDPAWKKYVIASAQYAAVAAIGLAGGLAVARYSSLASEFRADKFAVEITQKPETFKKMLTNLHEARGVKLGQKDHAFKQSLGYANGFLEKAEETLNWILKKTIHAHPTLEQRLSHVDKLVQNSIGGMPLR